MVERSAESREICFEFAFDRLLSIKLQQVYGLLVADRARAIRQSPKENGEETHEAGSNLRESLLGQAEGGAHDCEPNRGAADLRLGARLQRSR